MPNPVNCYCGCGAAKVLGNAALQKLSILSPFNEHQGFTYSWNKWKRETGRDQFRHLGRRQHGEVIGTFSFMVKLITYLWFKINNNWDTLLLETSPIDTHTICMRLEKIYSRHFYWPTLLMIFIYMSGTGKTMINVKAEVMQNWARPCNAALYHLILKSYY